MFKATRLVSVAPLSWAVALVAGCGGGSNNAVTEGGTARWPCSTPA